MKFFFACAIVILFSVTACDSKRSSGGGADPSGGGIEVGNGMQMYRSSTHGFTLKYSSVLTLKENSDDTFRIDNEGLVKDAGQISYLEFSGVSGDVGELKEIEALRTYVEKKHASDGFTVRAVESSQGLGIVAEKTTKDDLKSFYYFISPKKSEVLKFTLSATRQGAGLALVAPVIKTFSYDGTPPVIHSIEFAAPRVRAGENIHITVEAEDESSGLSEGMFQFYMMHRDPVIRGTSILQKRIWIEKENIGERNLYHFVVPTNEFHPGGIYDVKITIADVARNETVSSTNELGKPLAITIEPNRPDTQGPNFIDLKFRSVVRIGKSSSELPLTGFLRATDDVSGLIGGKVVVDFYHSGPTHAQAKFAWQEETVLTELHQINANGYVLVFPNAAQAPSGDYEVKNIEIYDKAGNSTEVRTDALAWENTRPKFGDDEKIYARLNAEALDARQKLLGSFHLENSRAVVLKDPTIKSLTVVPNVIRPGGQGTLQIQMEDNQSLIGGRVYAVFIPEVSGKDKPSIRISRSITEESRVSPTEYRFSFTSGAYLPGGSYVLDTMFVTTREWRSYFVVTESLLKKWRETRPSAEASPFPLPKIEIKRD